MRMVNATASGSYKVNQGSRGVLVGIMDTGIDGSHPDLALNFNRKLSRNFATDIPLVDGLCEDEPDQSCNDPADVDENGHGTHVAGIVGAAINGLGVAGVAPKVTLVNIRAGQDSGFFFLDATINAMVYAADRRHRRGEHELLHRPVAVQLREQSGRLAAGAGRAAHHHRGHPARGELRPQARRDLRGRLRHSHGLRAEADNMRCSAHSPQVCWC